MVWPWSCLVPSSVPKRKSFPKRRINFLGPREKAKKFVTGADQESGQIYCSNGTGLRDLPECIITAILCLTRPADVARLACVNRSFRAAAYSDNVWLKMLPPSYTLILAQASDAPARTCSKKEVYDFLTEGVFLQDGNRQIWLDRATGAVCQSIGARELSIKCYNKLLGYPSGSQTPFLSLEGSRIAEVECISARRNVNSFGWEESLSKGSRHCSLSPGTYVLFWRLCLRNESKGSLGPGRLANRLGHRLNLQRRHRNMAVSGAASLNRGTVNATCHLASGSVCLSKQELHEVHQIPPLGYRVDPGGWIELDVRKFYVSSNDSQIEVLTDISLQLVID